MRVKKFKKVGEVRGFIYPEMSLIHLVCVEGSFTKMINLFKI